MRDELRALQKRLGITSLYVTHDQIEAMAISDLVVIMKNGDLMQIGTPKEIYEYPASKFVANFIGKANFISALYEGAEGSAAVVRVADQVFKISNPGAVRIEKGEKCCLTFRPESVKLSASETGIPGIVKRVTFLGSNVEYELDSGGTSLIIEIYNPQLFTSYREGEKVSAVLDLECVRVLPDTPLDGD
jgi:iron(III) transport system ATP-binding protein